MLALLLQRVDGAHREGIPRHGESHVLPRKAHAVHPLGILLIPGAGIPRQHTQQALPAVRRDALQQLRRTLHPQAAALQPIGEAPHGVGMAVGIGEIGLDYHYDFSPRELQKEIFELQLKLSKELDLPVIVHDREAHEDTMTLLKKYRPKGVVHCFSGSVEMAREVLKLGMYIGLGGAVTFKNAKKPVAVAAATDIDRILLETDCPYMAPVPFRGMRCSSDMIAYSAQTIASVKNMDVQTLVDAATENTKRLFGIEF